MHLFELKLLLTTPEGVVSAIEAIIRVTYLLSVAKCSSSCAFVIFDSPLIGVGFDSALEVFDFFFLGTTTFKDSTSAVSSFSSFKAIAFFCFVQLYIALFTADFVSAIRDFEFAIVFGV